MPGYGQNGNDLTTFMNPGVSSSEFLGKLKNTNKIGINFKYQLFGVAFKAFKGLNVVEMNLRSQTNVALPKSLFEFMKEAGAKTDYNIDKLGLRSENFLEFGLGHSHKIDEKWTVGGKMKLLFGLAYADVSAENLNLHLAEDMWQIKGDVRGRASLMKTEVELSEKTEPNPAPGTTPRHRIHGLDDFKGGLSGFGLAFDLGATYQVIPDLKLSASITDLGFINWKNMHQASSAGEWTLTASMKTYTWLAIVQKPMKLAISLKLSATTLAICLLYITMARKARRVLSLLLSTSVQNIPFLSIEN